MNYEQLTGILRAVLPGALAYCVGKGWISTSEVADISAAVVAVAAAVWSYISNKTGKVAGTGGVVLSPGQRAGAGIGSAIVLGFLLFGGNAHAADQMVPKARLAISAPAPVATSCEQLSCTGFYLSGVVYGIGGNAAIIQNGIQNSIFAGGGDIGLNAGWQYWDGKYFIGFDIDGMVESQNTARVVGFAGNSGAAVGMIHIKIGGNLANLIAAGPAPIGVPSQLSSAIMASYIDNCTAIRKGGTQYCGGAGTQFWLAPKVTMDLLYDYGAPTKNFNALQNVGAKVSYHF
jgi:hypothetical protein